MKKILITLSLFGTILLSHLALASHLTKYTHQELKKAVLAEKHCPLRLQSAFGLTSDSKPDLGARFDQLISSNHFALRYGNGEFEGRQHVRSNTYQDILIHMKDLSPKRLILKSTKHWNAPDGQPDTTVSCQELNLDGGQKSEFVDRALSNHQVTQQKIGGLLALLTCYEVFAEALTRAQTLSRGQNVGGMAPNGSLVNSWEFETANQKGLKFEPVEYIRIHVTTFQQSDRPTEVKCSLAKTSQLLD